MKSNSTGEFLGTVEDRIKAYKKDKDSNINIQMWEARLDELRNQGIYESKEIDSILDKLHPMYEKLKYGWGLENETI